MKNRREADRAEAIVRGIGAIIMMVVLVVMVRAVPHVTKGKDTGEAMGAMLRMITWFTGFGGLVM